MKEPQLTGGPGEGRPAGPESGKFGLDKGQARKLIDEGARLNTPYLVMNALATVVAAYGLLANSTAVVIGAMIIAMLLGPIMGLALALVDGDVRLLRSALIAEVAGAALVLVIAALIGRLHADLPLTAEIVSRTKPNLLDLAIALGGGAAGAYATVSPRVSVGLVGVAISTALVPPLAACGICLSRGLSEQAGGAFILFVTNLVAIQCAASAVLFAFGFHEVTQRKVGDRSFLWRLLVDAILLLGLTVFLYSQLTSVVHEQQFEEGVKTRLEKGLSKIPGAYLAETRFVAEKDADVVVAVVRVPNSITPDQAATIEATLPRNGSRQIQLHVRSLLTKEATAHGYLHEIEPTAPPVDEIVRPEEQGATREAGSPDATPSRPEQPHRAPSGTGGDH